MQKAATGILDTARLGAVTVAKAGRQKAHRQKALWLLLPVSSFASPYLASSGLCWDKQVNLSAIVAGFTMLYSRRRVNDFQPDAAHRCVNGRKGIGRWRCGFLGASVVL